MTKKAHNKIAKVIQEIWDEEKVRINQVSIDWFDSTNCSDYKYLIHKVSVDSETRYLAGNN